MIETVQERSERLAKAEAMVREWDELESRYGEIKDQATAAHKDFDKELGELRKAARPPESAESQAQRLARLEWLERLGKSVGVLETKWSRLAEDAGAVHDDILEKIKEIRTSLRPLPLFDAPVKEGERAAIGNGRKKRGAARR